MGLLLSYLAPYDITSGWHLLVHVMYAGSTARSGSMLSFRAIEAVYIGAAYGTITCECIEFYCIRSEI